jgi:hypothetical protein
VAITESDRILGALHRGVSCRIRACSRENPDVRCHAQIYQIGIESTDRHSDDHLTPRQGEVIR